MVSPTVVALIEDHKRVISDFDVAATQAVEEHLGDHDCDGCLLHLLQEGLTIGHQTLNPLSFGDGLIVTFLSVNADDLAIQVFHLPIQLDILIAQSLPQVAGKLLIPENGLKGDLDSLSLLLDQLDGVGQKDDLLACSELAEVVIHGADGDTGLSCTGGQVDDTVAVP